MVVSQCRSSRDRDFGDGHAFVSVEEAEDFAVDFFWREGLDHILHGQGVERGKVIGVKDRHNDGIGSEWSAALGRGVETFEIGDAGTEERVASTPLCFGMICSVFRFGALQSFFAGRRVVVPAKQVGL